MTSDTVGVASKDPGGVFSKVSRQTPGPYGSIQDPEEHFRKEWKTLTEEMRDHRESSDVNKRLQRDNFDQALDLAVQYPDFVDVSSKPVDEEVPDMVDHVQRHFDAAFNEEGFAPTHSVPTESDFQTLIRSCEVVYLDDAVLRFATRWIFDPVFDDLNEKTFNELPDQLGQWMEQAQLMWDAFAGIVDLPKKQIDGLVETLYSSRTDFVETAIDMDLFLPIPPADYDPEDPIPNLRTKFTRQDEIPPEGVHRYCYRRVLNEY